MVGWGLIGIQDLWIGGDVRITSVVFVLLYYIYTVVILPYTVVISQLYGIYSGGGKRSIYCSNYNRVTTENTGVATVGVAIIAKFVLLDFPHISSILTLEEQQLAAVRILADSKTSAGHERLSHWEAFKAAVCDVRTYVFMLVLVLDVGAGTISYFIPTITKSLGYTTIVAQYMTVPVYIVATICLNACAYSADRFGERRWHVAGALFIGFLAALVCAIVEKPVVRYVMLCFVAAGIWSALPLILAWASKTLDFPAEKRAICIAMINAVGNLLSVYGSQIWPSTSAPHYTLGWGITAGFLGAGTVVAVLIPVILKFVPLKGTAAERILREIFEEDEIAQ